MKKYFEALVSILYERIETALIFLFVLFFALQLNLYPFECFPGWDFYWIDCMTARLFVTVGRAMSNFEIAAIDPYAQFGVNITADIWGLTTSPLALLGAILPHQAAVWVCKMLVMTVGGVGGFLYLRYLTGRRFLSLVGGLAYIIIPNYLSHFFFYVGTWTFFFLPLFLLAIHRAIEKQTKSSLLVFAVMAYFGINSGSVTYIFVFPPATLVYAFFVAWRYHGVSFLNSIKQSLILLVLCLLAGALYLVPMDC